MKAKILLGAFLAALLWTGSPGPVRANATPGAIDYAGAVRDGSVRSEYVQRRGGRRAAAHGRVRAGRSATVRRSATVNRRAAVNRRPAVRRNVGRNVNVRRNVVVNRRVNVVRPVRPWVRRPYYGRVVGGVALGSLITAAAIGAVPPAPAPNLCWYWANTQRTRGYWDYCRVP